MGVNNSGFKKFKKLALQMLYGEGNAGIHATVVGDELCLQEYPTFDHSN